MAKIIKIILPVNIITSFFSTILNEKKRIFVLLFICPLSIDNMTVFDYDFGINENKDIS